MISVREFHRPKLGNSDVEYEDAFACNFERKRFAIADGASESIFSNIWADSLVNAFTNLSAPISAEEEYLRQIIYSARKRWYNSINWDSLRLFVRNKALGGSYSTFLGAQIFNYRGGHLCKIISVGDSCIFIIRDSEGITSFPINDPKKFNISPKLIWSGYGSPFPEDYNAKVPPIEHYEVTLEPGDRLLLATDAISKWIMENLPGSLQQIGNGSNSYGFITGLLESREMRNDDITYSWVTLEP